MSENYNYLYKIDNLDYDYDGNQLKKVVDSSNSDEGFKDGSNTGDDYTYDKFGNMTVDQNKNITQITYNHLNLPTKITFHSGAHIAYTYDAAGVKQRKKLVDGNEVSITDYLGGFQYRAERKENSRWLFLANEPGGVWAELQFFPHAEGYVSHVLDANDDPVFKYVYQYKDHLGSIRMNYTFDTDTNELKILEENHYYPPDNIRDGLKHDYYAKTTRDFKARAAEGGGNDWQIKVEEVPNSGYQYKYQGQEYQDEVNLNWYSFKWRNADPAIGRFLSIDPLAESYPYNSTYAFSENRVVDGVELEGLEYVDADEALIEIRANGKTYYKIENHNGFTRAAYNTAMYNPPTYIDANGQKSIGVNLEYSTLDIDIVERKHVATKAPLIKESLGNFGRQRGASKALLVVAAIDFVASASEFGLNWYDSKQIKKQVKLLNEAKGNLVDFTRSYELAGRFMNTEDLSSILNVILQGTPSDKFLETDKAIEHMIIGLTIYNEYNDDPISEAILWSYEYIYSVFTNSESGWNSFGGGTIQRAGLQDDMEPYIGKFGINNTYSD